MLVLFNEADQQPHNFWFSKIEGGLPIYLNKLQTVEAFEWTGLYVQGRKQKATETHNHIQLLANLPTSWYVFVTETHLKIII